MNVNGMSYYELLGLDAYTQLARGEKPNWFFKTKNGQVFLKEEETA